MNTRTRNTRSITIWSSRNSSSLHSSRIEFMCRQRQAQMHTILMVIIPFHRASSSKPSTIDWYVSVYLMGCHNCTRNSWISVRMRFTDTDAFCFKCWKRNVFIVFFSAQINSWHEASAQFECWFWRCNRSAAASSVQPATR